LNLERRQDVLEFALSQAAMGAIQIGQRDGLLGRAPALHDGVLDHVAVAVKPRLPQVGDHLERVGHPAFADLTGGREFRQGDLGRLGGLLEREEARDLEDRLGQPLQRRSRRARVCRGIRPCHPVPGELPVRLEDGLGETDGAHVLGLLTKTGRLRHQRLPDRLHLRGPHAKPSWLGPACGEGEPGQQSTHDVPKAGVRDEPIPGRATQLDEERKVDRSLSGIIIPVFRSRFLVRAFSIGFPS
jgi:hypothetical protein